MLTENEVTLMFTVSGDQGENWRKVVLDVGRRTMQFVVSASQAPSQAVHLKRLRFSNCLCRSLLKLTRVFRVGLNKTF